MPEPIILEPSFVGPSNRGAVILEPLLAPGSTGQLLGPGGYPISTITPADQLAAQFQAAPRALPAAGTTRVYNNPGLSRRLSAASRLGRSFTGSAPRAGAPGTFGRAIGPAGNAGAMGAAGVADDVARAGGAVAGETGESLLRQIISGGRQRATAPISIRGRNIVGGGRGALAARGLGGAAAGIAAGSLIDQFNLGGEGSLLDRLASNVGGGAIGGAAFGGGLPGALVGGALGVLGTLLGGGGEPGPSKIRGEVVKSVRTQLAALGVDRDVIDKAIQRFRADFDAAEDDAAKEFVVRQYAGYFDEVIAAKSQAAGNPLAETFGLPTASQDPTSFPAPTPEEMAQIQVLIGQMMQPYVEDMQSSAAAQANWMNEHAGNLSGAEADLYRLQASQYQASGDRLAAAYMAQAQLIPQMIALNQARQRSYQQPAADADFASLIEAIGAGQG